MSDAKLLARAREFYDDDTGAVRRDSSPKPLTGGERRLMLDFVAANEDPIRADAGDTFVAGMFAGAVRRAERRARWEREAAANIAEVRIATTKRERARGDAQRRAKIDFAKGLTDGERLAAERAAARASVAEVRRALQRNGHHKPTEDEIRESAAERAANRWRKS